MSLARVEAGNFATSVGDLVINGSKKTDYYSVSYVTLSDGAYGRYISHLRYLYRRTASICEEAAKYMSISL